jgi:myosin heavy subunit
MFLPGWDLSPISPRTAGQVELELGSRLTFDGNSSLMLMDPLSLEPIDDMAQMSNLDEPSLLHNLRMRFSQHKIYTNVSSILISVNPFERLPLYTPAVLRDYTRQSSNLPPHVYTIADKAYRSLLEEKICQSVIISGESGAGKTEATKKIIQFLAEVSDLAVGAGQQVQNQVNLESRLIDANPLMEAFGNAKTVRNDNSSRFGKWTSIEFSSNGRILGGNIVSYLLEKTRVVFQSQLERNYHIFYQALAGAKVGDTLLSCMRLESVYPADYCYLNQSYCYEVA